VGPLRVTAAGWATPAEVRRAAWTALGIAALLGLVLVWIGGWVILAIGLSSIAAAWAYSGGQRPVSYRASGELFVLVFFGLVAVTGTHYLQAGINGPPWRCPRDSPSAPWPPPSCCSTTTATSPATSPRAGARSRRRSAGTRASRLRLADAPALRPAAWLALREPAEPGAWLAFLALPLALTVVRDMGRLEGSALNPVLARTALTQFAFGVLLSAGVLP
jgi:1,4-dihydroxy-2-naphthoate polyprenyltransferase